MQFRVLGPVRAFSDDGMEIPLGGPKQRGVFALLLSSPARSIDTDRLIDELWPDEGNQANRKTVQAYVSRLRASFADHGAAETVSARLNGYQIDATYPTDTDEYETALHQARTLIHEDPSRAMRLLAEADALWRGRPFEDAYPARQLELEALRLEEQRLAGYEVWAEAGLAAGRHREISSKLRHVAEANPLDERLWELLMVALYRSGRQAEALETYVALARRLRNELGVEPGPELADLQRRMLEQDPALGGGMGILDVVRRRSSLHGPRLWTALAGVGMLVGAIVIAIASLAGRAGTADGPMPHVSARYPVSAGAARITAADGRIWVLDPATAAVTAVDPTDGEATTYDLPGLPSAIAGGLGAVWLASEAESAIWKVDASTGSVVASADDVDLRGAAMAVGPEAVWIARESIQPFLRVAPDDLAIDVVPFADAFGGPAQPAIDVADGGLWASNALLGRVMSVDPRTGAFEFAGDPRISDHAAKSILADHGAIWFSQPTNGSVTRLDAGTGSFTATARIGEPSGRGFGRIIPGYGIAAGPGGVWVGSLRDHTVTLLDDRTAVVRASLRLDGPTSITATATSVWVLDTGSHELVQVMPGSCASLPVLGPGVDLRGCDLSTKAPIGVDLTGADLRWADLRFARLQQADLTGADLYGADLAGASLDGVTWAGTRCPDGSLSDRHGASCAIR